MTQQFQLTLVRQKYTPYGGAERFVSRTLETLSAQGLDIRVMARKWQGDTPFTVEQCNPFYLGRLSRDSGFGRAVCNRLSKRQGLVQSHERIPCCDIYRAGDGVHREWLRQRARLRGKLSESFSQLSPYHRYTLNAEARLFNSSRLKAVICNSAMVQKELQEWFGMPEKKLPVIHNGVDSNKFHPALRDEYLETIRNQWNIPLDAPLFLYVGSGFERKGLGPCIEAMKRLNEPSARLLAVGKDRNTGRYKKLAAKLGVDKQVIFAGPQNDVRPYYAAADVLLLPTLYDPFPNVVLEGMACGLPVITSTKSGSTDIIEQGVNGYYCDALDSKALAGFMGELLIPKKRQAVGNAARATVEPMTLERMAEDYLALYQRLLQT